jgi:hypothetical protein
MHLDFTIHFWSALTQFLALVGLGTFLWKTYRLIARGVHRVIAVLDEHNAMYGWYQSQIKPNGEALGHRHVKRAYESR